jgi:chromosome segregation ATPase
MTKIEKLQSQLVAVKNEVERCKTVFLAKKRELIEIENSLVEARENERRIQGQIDEYRNTFEIEHSLDDERLAEIEAYRKRMPEMMEKIKNEPVIPIVNSGTLGTMKDKK